MTVSGQLADRSFIHDALERARIDLHHLVASASTADLHQRTDGIRLTNQQRLWHIAVCPLWPGSVGTRVTG